MTKGMKMLYYRERFMSFSILPIYFIEVECYSINFDLGGQRSKCNLLRIIQSSDIHCDKLSYRGYQKL